MPTPIDIEIVNKSFCAIAEEMGLVVERSAYSPNIKERRDFSCAIFDHKGQLIAQAAHIPVHLGAMPDTVKVVKETFRLSPGDIVITNDPYAGGTHLPDITMIQGVFRPSEIYPSYYLVVRAHHADVGGTTPGSMPLAHSIHDEGVLIKPTIFAKKGELIREFLNDFLQKVRNPVEREGDLKAQAASLKRGEARILELEAKYGPDFLDECIEELLNYGERITKSVLEEIPDGLYSFTDYLDDDGISKKPIPVSVDIEVSGNELKVDFSRTGDAVSTGLNAVRSVTSSAVYYCIFCLIGEGYPVNSGTLRPIQIVTRPGSLVDAIYPSPVAAGNVETSQRIVDVVFGALSKAIPHKIPAASAGTMNNVALGGTGRDGREFTYYETIGGGMGARPFMDGLSAIQTNMTNTLNTPVEALERDYPLMVEEYSIRRGSGGSGKFRGGDGIIRRIRFLRPTHVTLLSERRRIAPYGLMGGEHGKRGLNRLRRKRESGWIRLPGKCHVDVKEGDLLEIRTPGGGGWGKNPT